MEADHGRIEEGQIVNKMLAAAWDLIYAGSMSGFVAFCYLPFIRSDYPWWTKPLGVLAAAWMIWIGRTTPTYLERKS